MIERLATRKRGLLRNRIARVTKHCSTSRFNLPYPGELSPIVWGVDRYECPKAKNSVKKDGQLH
jgi:hypothetical protein